LWDTPSVGDVAGQEPEEQPARREPKASNEDSLSEENKGRVDKWWIDGNPRP